MPLSRKGEGHHAEVMPLSKKGEGHHAEVMPLSEKAEGHHTEVMPLSKKGEGHHWCGGATQPGSSHATAWIDRFACLVRLSGSIIHNLALI